MKIQEEIQGDARNEYISVTVVITRTHSMGNGSMAPRLVLLLLLPILSYLKDCSVDIDICKLFQINLIVLLQYMVLTGVQKDLWHQLSTTKDEKSRLA